MKLTLTLTPVGADYDLYALFDPNGDLVECTTVAGSSVHPGTGAETVSLAWGEGTVANGKDDSRTVEVVVSKPGPCNDAGQWKLTAEGNK